MFRKVDSERTPGHRTIHRRRAGAVADEVLAAMINGQEPARAYVNNGGDIAFHLSENAQFSALGPAAEIVFDGAGAARGVATSG